jgi:hypothetical protein
MSITSFHVHHHYLQVHAPSPSSLVLLCLTQITWHNGIINLVSLITKTKLRLSDWHSPSVQMQSLVSACTSSIAGGSTGAQAKVLGESPPQINLDQRQWSPSWRHHWRTSSCCISMAGPFQPLGSRLEWKPCQAPVASPLVAWFTPDDDYVVASSTSLVPRGIVKESLCLGVVVFFLFLSFCCICGHATI